jgi:hypothetical protein
MGLMSSAGLSGKGARSSWLALRDPMGLSGRPAGRPYVRDGSAMSIGYRCPRGAVSAWHGVDGTFVKNAAIGISLWRRGPAAVETERWTPCPAERDSRWKSQAADSEPVRPAVEAPSPLQCRAAAQLVPIHDVKERCPPAKAGGNVGICSPIVKSRSDV